LIPDDGVTGIFHLRNTSGRAMALGSTQPLTEMSTRVIARRIKQPIRRAYSLTTLMCWLKSWCLKLLEPPGSTPACVGIASNLFIFNLRTTACRAECRLTATHRRGMSYKIELDGGKYLGCSLASYVVWLQTIRCNLLHACHECIVLSRNMKLGGLGISHEYFHMRKVEKFLSCLVNSYNHRLGCM